MLSSPLESASTREISRLFWADRKSAEVMNRVLNGRKGDFSSTDTNVDNAWSGELAVDGCEGLSRPIWRHYFRLARDTITIIETPRYVP